MRWLRLLWFPPLLAVAIASDFLRWGGKSMLWGAALARLLADRGLRWVETGE